MNEKNALESRLRRFSRARRGLLDSAPLKQAVIRRAADDLKEKHEARLDRADRNRRRVRFAVTVMVFLTLGLTEGLGFRVFDTLGRSWSALQDYLFPVEYDLEPGG